MIHKHTRSLRMYVGDWIDGVGWRGLTVFWHLHAKSDALGRLEVKPDDGLDGLADRLRVPKNTVRVGLEVLMKLDLVRWEPNCVTPGRGRLRGVTLADGGVLSITDFVPAQREPLSASLRMRNQRARQRAIDFWDKRRSVTLRNGPSNGVTKETVTVAEAKEQGLITRTQAAHILGVSLATLRRREGKTVTPIVTELGEHVFRESEVRAAAAKEVHSLAPAQKPRDEEEAERSDDPIWRTRAARLAEKMGTGSYTSAEMHAIAKRCGIKDSVVEDALAAAEGVELVKENGKWSAAVPAGKAAK